MGRLAASDDERLTTVGLLFESAAGLRRVFERRLETERSLSNQSFDVLIRLARTPGGELRMSELAAQTSLTPSGLTERWTACSSMAWSPGAPVQRTGGVLSPYSPRRARSSWTGPSRITSTT